MIPLTTFAAPGFHPAAPLEYADSRFWLFLGLAAVCVLGVTAVVVALIILLTDEDEPVWPEAISSIGAVATIALLTSMFVALTPRYDAPTEAARWANLRYGTDLDPADAEALLSDIKCADGQVCTNTIRHDGQTITAKFVSGRTVLVDSAENGAELPVIHPRN